MSKKITFISDFFIEQGVTGGAEAFNDELVLMLTKKGYTINKINSENFIPTLINDETFYIVSNFMKLSEASKLKLQDRRYIILEHDHKYVSTNDPSKFKNMIAPFDKIINKGFFEQAEAVFCQSQIHADVLQKNLLLDTVVNIGCNLWSEDRLAKLEKLLNTSKTRKNGVLFSNNKNKGMLYAVQYCDKNNIDFEFIKPSSYESFILELAKTERIFFFPQWLESFNRVIIEARILNCKVTSNKLIGATYEPWFKKYKGKELLEFLRNQREEICDKFIRAVEKKQLFFLPPIEPPKISIITSMFKAGKYISHFMEEVAKQTIFDQCELIIVDANSPDNEYEIIKRYINKHRNIVYKRLDSTLSVQETMNIAIKESTGEFLTLWNVDDTRSYNYLEIMSKYLKVDPGIDLVYSDCYQTTVENQIVEDNSSNGAIYGHSVYPFSRENMIKCLPGPMPLWKKSMTEETGLFDEQLKFAGDWDMWLRCVEKGYKFKKVPYAYGLYYINPDGLSTSSKNNKERFREERDIFNKYKHVFGEKVYNKFKGYFNG